MSATTPPLDSWWATAPVQASRAEFYEALAAHRFRDPDAGHYEWLAYEAKRRKQRDAERIASKTA